MWPFKIYAASTALARLLFISGELSSAACIEYQIGVLSEYSQIITASSGNAKTYSSLPKASGDQEVGYIQSGDITKARACMKN